MPQMAPISWLALFLLFSFTFIIFNMINYSCFLLKNKSKNYLNKNNETFKMNWKW